MKRVQTYNMATKYKQKQNLDDKTTEKQTPKNGRSKSIDNKKTKPKNNGKAKSIDNKKQD